MTTTPRLALRGQTFYFRMALPCDLAAVFERREIKRSLRTSDRTLATLRCRAISNHVDLLCREARMMLEKQNDAIDEQVRAYFKAELDSGVDFAEVFAPEPEVDLDSEIESIKRRMSDYKRLLSRQGCASHLQDAAGKIVDTIPPEILKSRHDALLRARRNLMRAEIEADRILVAKLQGDYSDTKVLDPLFEGVEPSAEPPLLAFPNLNFDPASNATAAPTASSAPSIETLVGEYFESLLTKGTAEKTMGDHRLTMELARAVIAFDKPITELVTSDVKALRDLIGRLPAHAAKNPLTRDLPLLEAVEVGKDMPRLDFTTQKKRLDFFKNFLRWLVAEEHIENVPGEKLVVNAVKSKEAARSSYEKSALHTIFHSPIWTGRKNHLHVTKPGTLKMKDSRFWIPLIALFSGMRAGEILQLLRSDIRYEDDVWFFDVSKGEGEDDKKLKTGTSWRRVPVHRVLLDLGFIAYVQKVKTGRIFADQSMGSDGTYSQLWSKFWGRYARKCGFHTPKHVFHSFRHNFVDALHDAGVPDSIAHQLCGHADKSAHAGYGKGASLKRLKEEIDRIEYPGLDLTHLLASDWKKAGHG